VRAAALFVWLFLVLGCEPRLAIGGSCDFSSDCEAPLVCRNARCRVACREARDCAAGLRCVVDASGTSCSLPVEDTCNDVTSPCPGTLVCSMGECRSECSVDSDCTANGRCAGGSCEEPPSGADAGTPLPDAGCTPGPMVCGNGVLDSCDASLADVARAVTGGASAELVVLARHVLPAATWPAIGVTPLEPEVALGVSALGYGVVGHIVENETRAVSLYGFPLGDLGAAAVAMLDRRDYSPPEPAIENALTLALAENGDEVTGFVLDVEPPSASGVSGHQLVFGPGATGTERPISAGDPPATSGGHLTIVGGASSVRATDFPIYYVTRELVNPSGPPSLGAIDEPLGMNTYRSIDTSAWSSALFVAAAGSAGSVAIFRDEAETIGIWNVERTPTLMDAGTRPADLVVADVDAAGTPAIELVAPGGLDYLLAVPTAGGSTRFYDLVCPAVGRCNAPRARAGEVQSRSGRSASEVHLASLPGGGHALLSIEPSGGITGAAIDLRFLGPELTPSETELAAPLVPGSSDRALSDVGAAAVRVVTDGSLVTVIVAVLVRDYERRQDHVELYGLRACTER
jgi:hypothetical protein